MIVDDHQMVREGLRQLLELEPDIDVIAEASKGLECLELLETVHPQLILMDISMPGINGIETTRLITAKHPTIKIVMLTIYQDDQYITEAIQAGAKGYVLKDVKRKELIKIIRLVIQDQSYIDPAVANKLFSHVKKSHPDSLISAKPQLTRRELEVLTCMVEGLKDRSISDTLHISENTVRSHIKSIYRKLSVSSKSQAVAKAINTKIITGT